MAGEWKVEKIKELIKLGASNSTEALLYMIKSH